MNKLFFIHIPKTAGTSVNSLLTEWYGKEKSLTHIESNAQWRAKTLQADTYSFLSGHITWQAQQRRLDKTWHTLTFLRRPDTHVISHLAWVRRLAEPAEKEKLERQSPQIRAIVEQLATRDLGNPDHLHTLVEWLGNSRSFLFHNTQTHYLSGSPGPDTSALRQALRNLELVTHVGITERVDEAIYRLAGLLGMRIRSAQAPTENAHPITFGLNAADPDILRTLEPLICHDWVLYDRARAIFIRQLHTWLMSVERDAPAAYSSVSRRAITARLQRPRLSNETPK